MIYPYITNLNKFKDQIILEICNENFNYRVILKPEYLFDDDFVILSQKYTKTEGEKKYIAQKVLSSIKKLTLSGECNFFGPLKCLF